MNKVILITGPSGVGKGTIEKELFADKSLNLTFSVSATTRNKRVGEKDKEHYFFITKDEFKNLISQNAFIEYSKHFDNYYGTLFSEIKKNIDNGKHVLVEVETTGAVNIINKYKEENRENELISIFITPPSIEELRNRILGRQSESEEEINSRIEKAKIELEYKKYFKYIVKNDNIKEAVNQIKQIIKGEERD